MDDNNIQDDTNKAVSDAAMQPAEKSVEAEDAAEPKAVSGEPQTSDESPKMFDVEPKESKQEARGKRQEEVKDEAKEVKEESKEPKEAAKETDEPVEAEPEEKPSHPDAKWYVVHTFAGHENRVATTLKQRIDAEHLENAIFDILVPTQDKIEIKAGKKEVVKEKIFPGYILVKMVLSDTSWLAVRTTQGVTSFVGMGNKPTPISDAEVRTIVKFTTQGPAPTFKDVFMVDDTVKIIDGPFAEFIGKVDSVDKEKGRVRVLVSIFGRETPVELDFLQVQKL